MKEKRVYVIPKIVMSHIDWSDYLDVEDVRGMDYHLISNDVWIFIAEIYGDVYTLEGFVKSWASDLDFPPRLHSCVRIIEVETEI